MFKKKITTSIIALTLILSLTLVMTPVSADAFHRVSGDLFIDGSIASAGIEVKIIFETDPEETRNPA